MKNPIGLRHRLLTLVGVLGLFNVLFIGLAAPGYATAETLCNTWNIYTVQNGPTSPLTFTTTKAYKINYFSTYHWNYGSGVPAGGTVGLRSSDGKTYGPWQVTTTPGQGGVPNANWIATPNVIIPPGTYTVIDSDPSTWSQNSSSGGRGFAEIQAIAALELELLYPVGPSTKVYTRGWLFGAKCKDAEGQDLSDKVEWSGTGSFQPTTGSQSRPTFGGAGSNTITLTCKVGNETVKKDFTVEAVSPNNYARVGSLAHCPADAHNCQACPHNVYGPVISGSPTVSIDGKPAARKGDPGIHGHCCGPNTFVIGAGDPEVLIDGKAAARIGDRTDHCGGVGQITTSVPAGATQAVQSLLFE